MKKIYDVLSLLFLLTFTTNADLITVTASAEASNNSFGRFIEYTFAFDINLSGYYTLEGSPQTTYSDRDGYDLFYARFDGPFNLPVSDLGVQSSINCGLTELSSSLSILLMSLNGNVLSVCGNLISDWQIGDTLDGLERGFYNDGSSRSIASQLIITDIAYEGSVVPEPSPFYMYFTGCSLLCCTLFAKRRDWLMKSVV